MDRVFCACAYGKGEKRNERSDLEGAAEEVKRLRHVICSRVILRRVRKGYVARKVGAGDAGNQGAARRCSGATSLAVRPIRR
jgi:hypothetical protein